LSRFLCDFRFERFRALLATESHFRSHKHDNLSCRFHTVLAFCSLIFAASSHVLNSFLLRFFFALSSRFLTLEIAALHLRLHGAAGFCMLYFRLHNLHHLYPADVSFRLLDSAFLYFLFALLLRSFRAEWLSFNANARWHCNEQKR
jgi:hypothetical protein